MNVRDAMSHEQVVELLPWLVNDSLDDDEKVSVLEHASGCVICRRELDDLERVRDSMTQAPAAIPAPDMRSINARIDALIDRQNWARTLLPRARDMINSHWRVALAAQSVLLVVLAGLLLWPRPENTAFTTLTNADALPNGSYVRVVFSPELATSELSALLDRFGLEVVSGPSRRGVYTLGLADALTAADRDKLLLYLQGDPRILFAQPVAGGEEP